MEGRGKGVRKEWKTKGKLPEYGRKVGSEGKSVGVSVRVEMVLVEWGMRGRVWECERGCDTVGERDKGMGVV